MQPQTWIRQTLGTRTFPSAAGTGSCDNMIKQSKGSRRIASAADKCSRTLARGKLQCRLDVHVVCMRRLARTAFLN